MEIDYKKLEEKGINIADRDYTKEDPQKMFCPKCKKDRKKHMNNKPLAVYWKDCYAKCFNCGDSFFFGKTEKIGHEPKTKQEQPKAKVYKKPGKLTNEEPLDENMRKWFEQRGIPAELAEAEGIAAKANISDATLVNALKALAADRVTSGDDKAGVAFVSAATALIDRMQKEKDLALKSRAQSIREDELKIAQEKLKLEQAKAANAVKAVEDPTLTDEERVKKIKGIFGIS